MHQVQDWAEVHRLFDWEGWATARIAHEWGMNRNKVIHLLGLREPPRYERTPAGSELDPYRGSTVKMLDTNPTAPATVVTGRLRRDTCGGGVTILKDSLRQIRPPRPWDEKS